MFFSEWQVLSELLLKILTILINYLLILIKILNN